MRGALGGRLGAAHLSEYTRADAVVCQEFLQGVIGVAYVIHEVYELGGGDTR